MIISRTPFRVSFVGGGTDIKEYYKNEQGCVLSTSIDKYIYVVVKKQIGIVEYKYKISWSKIENCNNIDEIQHPIIRETLRILKIDYPIQINTFADIPSSSGLGSSSAFCVGLINALFTMQGKMATKSEIAKLAAYIEIEVLNRNIGKQDHYASCYGGLNIIKFEKDDSVIVEPIPITRNKIENIEKNLQLFYTGMQRDASEILKSQIEQTQDKYSTLTDMKKLVPQLSEELINGGSSEKIGKILNYSWILKKSITDDISNKKIDELYNKAIDAGSFGGKILGAGGGGFLLLSTALDFQENVRRNLSTLNYVPFKFDYGGTRITYFDQGL